MQNKTFSVGTIQFYFFEKPGIASVGTPLAMPMKTSI